MGGRAYVGGVHDGGVVLGVNERVRNLDIEVLSDHWYVLRKATFDYLHRNGTWTREVREAYDRGNGVVILLYDPDAGTVLLTRQFRLPAFVNGHPDGMLIEAAAGLLDGEDPEAAIRREAEEESGVRVGEITRLFELFMSPGSVTERVTFFAATYSHAATRLGRRRPHRRGRGHRGRRAGPRRGHGDGRPRRDRRRQDRAAAAVGAAPRRAGHLTRRVIATGPCPATVVPMSTDTTTQNDNASTVETTVDTYLATWNETDPAKRAALIEASLGADLWYRDPMLEADGLEAYDGMIAAVQAQFPGLVMTRTSPSTPTATSCASTGRSARRVPTPSSPASTSPSTTPTASCTASSASPASRSLPLDVAHRSCRRSPRRPAATVAAPPRPGVASAA